MNDLPRDLPNLIDQADSVLKAIVVM